METKFVYEFSFQSKHVFKVVMSVNHNHNTYLEFGGAN